MLQSLPTARDPWVILEQTPGIAMDRTNVGGSQSGPAVRLHLARLVDGQQQVDD